MKVKVTTLGNVEVEEAVLSPAIFALPLRPDILQRVVEWQRAKRQRGTHKTKGISDISGTTRKPHKQKGTGRARQGSLRSPQFRGGATIFGPVVRSHAHHLTKKFRNLGLRTALSVKYNQGLLRIVDKAELHEPKTKLLSAACSDMQLTRPLFVTGEQPNPHFRMASNNLPSVHVLPVQGINVLDILRFNEIVLTKEALTKLEERLQ